MDPKHLIVGDNYSLYTAVRFFNITDCNLSAVRTAWKQAILELHPDKNNNKYTSELTSLNEIYDFVRSDQRAQHRCDLMLFQEALVLSFMLGIVSLQLLPTLRRHLSPKSYQTVQATMQIAFVAQSVEVAVAIAAVHYCTQRFYASKSPTLRNDSAILALSTTASVLVSAGFWPQAVGFLAITAAIVSAARQYDFFKPHAVVNQPANRKAPWSLTAPSIIPQ